MAVERKSVTIPLTARQKDRIKKATGRSISALKVENASGRTVVKTARMKLTRGTIRPGGPYLPT